MHSAARLKLLILRTPLSVRGYFHVVHEALGFPGGIWAFWLSGVHTDKDSSLLVSLAQQMRDFSLCLSSYVQKRANRHSDLLKINSGTEL